MKAKRFMKIVEYQTESINYFSDSTEFKRKVDVRLFPFWLLIISTLLFFVSLLLIILWPFTWLMKKVYWEEVK